MKKIYTLLLLLKILSIQNPNILISQWNVIGNINTNQLNSVYFFDQNTGITVGAGGIWRSTNGGFNWAQVLTGSNLNSVSFTDYNNGLSVGDSGKIFKTTDGGLSWVQETSSILLNLYSISFPSSYVAYTAGANGVILKTANSGVNWQTQITIGYDINCIKMQNINTGYACGGSGRQFVVNTANGGYNWVGTIGNTGPSLRSIDAVGPTLVITVGENGRIWKSTNNGAYWSYPASNTTVNLNSVVLTNPYIMYICGNSGKILISTNGGDNWTAQNSNTPLNLNCLSFINSLTGWAVGQNGVVVNLGLPVGVNKISEKVPFQFKLYQNYPNPFNPSTIIRFDVPEKANIKLILFDICGKKVKTILNNYFERGSYEVKLDATNLQSGIYFYKTVYNNFFQSKKLIVIK